MKKFNFKQLKFHRVNIQEMNDRLLLINLYITQLIVLLIAAIVMFFFRSRTCYRCSPPLRG